MRRSTVGLVAPSPPDPGGPRDPTGPVWVRAPRLVLDPLVPTAGGVVGVFEPEPQPAMRPAMHTAAANIVLRTEPPCLIAATAPSRRPPKSDRMAESDRMLA